MDKFENSDTPEKIPGDRQRSISETEIDFNSPGSEKGKKKTRKTKYLSLWSSKRSLDEGFLVSFILFLFLLLLDFVEFISGFWGLFLNLKAWNGLGDDQTNELNRQESSASVRRKSKKGLVRFLSFRKLKKKKYKIEDGKDSPELSLSEEISLMEEESPSLEGLNEELKIEDGHVKKTEGPGDEAGGQVSSNDSQSSPELRNTNSDSAQLTEIKLVEEYSSFEKGSKGKPAEESRKLFFKTPRELFFKTTTSEEEIESDGKRKMDESSGAIKKSRGRLKQKFKSEDVDGKKQPGADEISKETDLREKEKAKEVKHHILSITKPILEKKELETVHVLDELENKKKEEEKPSVKTEDEKKTSEIVPGSDVIKDIDKGKGDMAHTEGKREHLYKILVIGELGTGKTSIIKRYVHQFFSQHYRATIGVDFALKVLNWDQNTIIRLQLWDIAGQERFGNMTRVYYKEAVGAFIVFDVTRQATFDAVLKWKHDLDSKVQLSDGSPIPCILLANKCDQPKEGLVNNHSKMDEYCREKGFSTWFETSAKENINIEEAARTLVTKILQNDKIVHNGEQNKDTEKFSLDRRSEKSSSKTCSC